MDKRKQQQHEAIRARAREAIADLYHNATLPSIRDLHGRSEEYANDWLRDVCEFEVEHLRGGGTYGTDYRKTLAADCNAGRYSSERARAFYIESGMRKMHEEREDCGMLTGWRVLELAAGNTRLRRSLGYRKLANGYYRRNEARWERIREFGKLYQYGRGGRTLAPDDLIRTRGGSSFSGRADYFEERSIASVVDGLRILESFNRCVMQWCAFIPEQWREHCAEEDAMSAAQRKHNREAKTKETRERNYWAARDVATL